MLALFQRLQRKKTYIAAYELLAEVFAYCTLPDLLKGRIVHHFVNNTAALAGSIKRYSSKPDCAHLIEALVVRVLRLGCRPWSENAIRAAHDPCGASLRARCFLKRRISSLCVMAV